MNKPQVVAITGGTGFLGFHLIPALTARGYRAVLLRRPGSFHPKMRILPARVEPRDVDFESRESLERAIAGADAVIHAAGLVSYDRKDQGRMHETHVELTRRMLGAARAAGARRFVHVSSIVTLGSRPVPVDETADYNAAALELAYWDTKTEAERLALAANDPARAFEVVVVNPGSLLGPGERSGQLLPFLRKLARAERPVLPAGGSDFLDVRDGAEGTVLALERGRAGERYVLGSENLSFAQLHERLRSLYGASSRPLLVPRWALGMAEKALHAFETATGLDFPVNSARLRRVNGVYMFHDVSKARRELGYEPRPIGPALRAMLEE